MAVVAIATPATLALSYYHLTGDPTFRPLAITVERLVSQGVVEDDNVYVRTLISTDGTPEGNRLGERLGEKLIRAFYGKGLTARYRIDPQPRKGPPQILIFVNGTALGPFTARTAPQGIRLATEAATITRQERSKAAGASRMPSR